jgi:hypothetical protein
MKKGLLLSLVASTVLFAGGDIAPVEPVAEAPAAACDDFYGAAGTGIIFNRSAAGVNTYTYGVAAVLGVTKELFSGVSITAEVQGGAFTDDAGVHTEVGGLTQLSLGYSFCNTAVKVGRFAVPGSLSPLVATGTDYFGMKKDTWEGVMVANTDIADTTIWGAYLYNNVHFGTTSTGLIATARTKVNTVAGGFRNTSFADTVITVAAYYGIDTKVYNVAASIDHKWCDTDLSVGGAYAKGGNYVAGGYATQHFGSVDATLAATYSNAAMKYAKYTDLTNGTVAGTTWAVGGKLSTQLSGYKFSVAGDYQSTKTWEASVGVAKAFSGINFAVDYRYNSGKAHRVRAKAVYKF